MEQGIRENYDGTRHKGKLRWNKTYRPGSVAEYETVRSEVAEDSDILVCSLS